MRAPSLLLGLLVCVLPLPAVASDGALGRIESEFRAVLERHALTTVACVPSSAPAGKAGFSSGVIVTSDGYVLSDGDAGLVWQTQGGELVKTWHSSVDIRVPRPTSGGFRTYSARVVRRDRSLDTCLLKIHSPPAEGLPFAVPGRSAGLRTGDLVFAVGSSAARRDGLTPSVTAGVVAAREPVDPEAPDGASAAIYSSAAVNEGVNGGALVDIEGRLVGTISTSMDPTADNPYQFLGKAIPIDRIRGAFESLSVADRVFPDAGIDRATAGTGRALERALHGAARTGRGALVSLAIDRAKPVSGKAPLDGKREDADLARLAGPLSGVVATDQGHVVTSLYNLTNVASLVNPLWRAPAGAGFQEGLDAVQGIAATARDGTRWPLVVRAVDRRLGIVLLAPPAPSGDAEESTSDARLYPTPPVPADDKALRRGRFVVALGDPLGPGRDALLTFGILSKRHKDTTAAPWRGTWQTDAGIMDSNAGGLAVDLDGRALGLLTLWNPAKHGRNSGIGFVVPWARVLAALPALLAGDAPAPGRLGIYFGRGLRPTVERPVEGGPAARAGVEAGDIVLRMDDHPTPSTGDAILYIRSRFAGERVTLRIERGDDVFETDVVLDPRAPDG